MEIVESLIVEIFMYGKCNRMPYPEDSAEGIAQRVQAGLVDFGWVRPTRQAEVC